MGLLGKAVSGFKSYASHGFNHALGAEPQKIFKGGRVDSSFWGRKISATSGDLGFRFGEGAKTPMSAMDGLGLVATLGMSANMAIAGYQNEGMVGVANALVADVAVNAAMVRHAYSYKKGADGSLIRANVGFGSTPKMLGRNITGSALAMAANHAVGGGVAGAAAGFVGGHVGVKHSWKVAAAYGGYQAAKMTGNAVMGVMKAGNQHRQRQKSINTSGSMAAFNTSGAHTMRQRAVQAIHKSHLNARSALGSEAQFMHMPGRNYNSRYR